MGRAGRGARVAAAAPAAPPAGCGDILAAARAPGGPAAGRRRRSSNSRAKAVPSMAKELRWLGLPVLVGDTRRLASPLEIPDGGSSATIADSIAIPAAEDFSSKVLLENGVPDGLADRSQSQRHFLCALYMRTTYLHIYINTTYIHISSQLSIPKMSADEG